MTILDGVLVVSLEHAVAAPLATRQLADLGARVIKVERPGRGDFARDYDDAVYGSSSHFLWLNRSKESVVLDLRDQDDRRTLDRLIQAADIFVHNISPEAATRQGLDAKTLRAAHPGLIHISISGYGPGGPYSSRKAYDLLIQCESGLLSITGEEDSPAKVGIPIADIAAGMYAFTGALTALLHRERTGQGATLELSMLEALAEWMGFPLMYRRYGGMQLPRTGASHAAIAPYGPVTCQDNEEIFFAVQNDREWERFCGGVIEDADLAADPRFRTNSLRVRNRGDLTRIIATRLATMPGSQVRERFEASDIAYAQVRNLGQVLEHPQLTSRGRWRSFSHPGGPVATLIPPATLEGQEPVLRGVPSLGEHTEFVRDEFGAASDGPNDSNLA